MTDRAILWIWLQDCIGFANAKAGAIFDFFEKPEDIAFAEEEFLRGTGFFTEHALRKILQKDFRYAKKIYDDCQKMGYKLMTLLDPKYPEKLKELSDCPILLYVEGEMPRTATNLYTAIVGSREATEDSKKYAFDIAAGLALNNIAVVSGGADGVDTAAHKGCMACEGKTICVMGCGLNSSYLLRNRAMRKDIANNGALISEYPPYMESRHYTFVQRNRIIAGISDCTLVVQAGLNSGSLKTYQEAKRNNRKVFFIKGDMYDSRFAGSNLLEAEGAEAINNHTEILDWYENNGHVIPGRLNLDEFETADSVRKYEKKNTQKPAEEDFKTDDDKILSERLTDNALMVYHTISDTPVTYDDISNQTGLPAHKVKSCVTELELMGYIKNVSGRGYIRK